MASTLSDDCSVRCPKCLRVLAELPNIPPLKCYGCDAILNAKLDSDNSSSDNGLAVYVEQLSSASHEPKKLEQGGSTRSEESKFNEVKYIKEVDSSVNGMKTLSISESYKLEEQSPESLEHDIKNEERNEDLRTGFRFRWKARSTHTYDRSFSLSDKLRQDHVTQKHLAVSRRTRCSRSYDRSFSSSEEHLQDFVPQKNLAVSRRTRSRQVLDLAEAAGRDSSMKNTADAEEEQSVAENHCRKFLIQSSENGAQAKELSLISQSKNNTEQVVRFHFSETDDQLKVLEKVDELKIELHRMFSNKSCGNEASSISIRFTHFEGTINSDDNQLSSLFRHFSRQGSNYSCRNGKGRLCEESRIHHCRPVLGGAPFVVCYKCYRLLLLPVDFLVSMKRVHKLRCGSCSEVLAYSFRPRVRAGMKRGC